MHSNMTCLPVVIFILLCHSNFVKGTVACSNVTKIKIFVISVQAIIHFIAIYTRQIHDVPAKTV